MQCELKQKIERYMIIRVLILLQLKLDTMHFSRLTSRPTHTFLALRCGVLSPLCAAALLLPVLFTARRHLSCLASREGCPAAFLFNLWWYYTFIFTVKLYGCDQVHGNVRLFIHNACSTCQGTWFSTYHRSYNVGVNSIHGILLIIRDIIIYNFGPINIYVFINCLNG